MSETPENGIRFRFLSDRFGFSPSAGGKGADKRETAAYLRHAEKSLLNWCAAIEELFGEKHSPEAQAWASTARILQRYPTWDGIQDIIARVSKLAERQEDIDVAGASQKLNETQSAKDDRLRTLADLAQLVRMLLTWSVPFRLGVWAASAAALGAIWAEVSARRLMGLQSLANVYSLDSSLSASEVAEELSSLTERERWMDGLPSNWATALRHALDAGRAIVESRTRSGATEDLERIDVLSAACDKDAKEPLPEFAGPKDDDGWRQIDLRFWQQWLWPSIGTPTRQSLLQGDGSGGPTTARVTLLDLLHAARHGGVPVVPWNGGNLSIAGWCRLLGLAATSDVPRMAVDCALSNLGLPWIIDRVQQLLPQRRYDHGGVTPRPPRLRDPVMVVYPLSNFSPAARWRPEPGIIALACPPSDVMAADYPAKVPGAVANRRGARRLITRIAELALERVRGPIHVIHCIEVDPDADAPSQERPVPLVLPSVASAATIYFAFTGEDHDAFILRPQDAGDLLERALDASRRSPLAALSVILVQVHGYGRRLRYLVGRMPILRRLLSRE